MKKFLLIAAFLFSCTSEIEDADSVWKKRPVPYEVIGNSDFAKCPSSFLPWEAYYGELDNSTSHGNIILTKDEGYGCGVKFTPSKNENNSWDLQLILRNLDIKPGYAYKLGFGGGVITTGTQASLMLALLRCEEDGTCTDYKEWEKSLKTNYDSYTYDDGNLDAWENCSFTDSNARFVISGGHSKVEFKITWINMWAEPINCP